jgi:hypothetical protein
MDSPALQKCLERFEKAKAALQRLERPKDLKETALAWSDLRVHDLFTTHLPLTTGRGRGSFWQNLGKMWPQAATMVDRQTPALVKEWRKPWHFITTKT